MEPWLPYLRRRIAERRARRTIETANLTPVQRAIVAAAHEVGVPMPDRLDGQGIGPWTTQRIVETRPAED